MTLIVKSFIAKNGERFSQIYDSSNLGFPLFHPTLYCVLKLRNSIKHKTQKSRMYVIKKILTWSQLMRISLDYRFEEARFLSKAECISLANFVIVKKNSKDGSTICNTKINDAITVTSDYLEWLAFTTCGNCISKETKDSIAAMKEEILRQKRKKGSSAAKDQEIIKKRLSIKTETELKEIFSNLLKIKTENIIGEIYFRNIVCIQILYETGMRLGELLSLQLSSFEHGTGGNEPSLSIKRNHDTPNDDRVDQPTAKTLERTLSISEDLSIKITHYLENYRQHINGVGFNPDDFIFINHLRGRRQGKPLQSSAFENAISRIIKKNQNLRGLHPHLLRHHWNYLFNSEAKELGYSEEQKRTTREYLMGWTDNSVQSARYNRLKIQEDAMEIGKKIVNTTARK
ncbi:site-specific integrase [Pseudomonas sp. PDM08]|uniref:site-specific integrase n=1 Tax=Pseudomonas sp. PDM08 TaxID=2769265 RepID=UPI00177B3F38|nr:site-specific integrase [Pseudomonas sp. PDM08]MBD9609810.1 tyrosine-type recombinase/integrase [Pseudomonas sp. PDM08]